MVPLELKPDEQWIRDQLNSRFISGVLTKAHRQDLIPQVSQATYTFIHSGSRSHVYRLTIPGSNGSHSGSSEFTLIVKRFLTPEQSIPMKPGIGCPTKRPLDQDEWINLRRLHQLSPSQPEPYHYDSQR